MKRPPYFSARLVLLEANVLGYVVPETLRGYELVTAQCSLSTDATVANRQMALAIRDRDGNVKTVSAEATFQTASESNLHLWGTTGSPYESAGQVAFNQGDLVDFAIHTPLQRVLVEGGDVVTIESDGQAGDSISSGILWFAAVPWLDENG